MIQSFKTGCTKFALHGFAFISINLAIDYLRVSLALTRLRLEVNAYYYILLIFCLQQTYIFRAIYVVKK